MSDLSRLLDDVYRSGSTTPAPPEWSSDSALDEAFSDWIPGEPASADDTMDQLDALVQQAAAMAPAEEDEPVDEPAPTAAAPMVENRETALRWTPERSSEASAPIEPTPPTQTITPWSRHDDDIRPRRGLGGRRRMSLRRR